MIKPAASPLAALLAQLALLALLVSPCSLGCGGPLRRTLALDPSLEGARGRLQVEPIEGETRLLTLVIEGLPPPRLEGGYVAWLLDADGETARRASLRYAPADRAARAHLIADPGAFTLLITAEPRPGTERAEGAILARHPLAPTNP